MRIALAAAAFRDGDTDRNLRQIINWMRTARTQGADLICFGESFLQGRDADHGVTADSRAFALLRQATAEFGIDVMFGYNEQTDGIICSSCALIGGGELLHNHRRLQRQSDPLLPFSYHGRKCLIALGDELWAFPESFRPEPDLLFWPICTACTPADWVEQECSRYIRQAGMICRHVLLFNPLCDGAPPYGGCCDISDGTLQSALPMKTDGLLLLNA